jgi:SOS-response transcriptional repressor LexA
MKRLTYKQAELLGYCGKFFAANDQLPPYHLIASDHGWSSVNAAVEMMEALERKGYIERNATGKWKFTAKGRAFITVYATAARWHPTSGSSEPISGIAELRHAG